MNVMEIILSAAGGIGIVGSAIAILIRAFGPVVRLNEKIRTLEAHEAKTDEAIREIQETNRLMCEGVLSILENTITGNSMDRLKDVKAKIQEYLIQK